MEQILITTLSIVLGLVMWYLTPRLVGSALVSKYVPARSKPLIESILRWIVFFLVLVTIMKTQGLTTATVLASISAFALVAAVAFFAYWSVLSNGTCSFLLLVFQPFRVGDRVEIRENENNIVTVGEVSSINLLYVTLSHVSEDGSTSLFRIPTNLLFQRTIRVWQGKDTKSLGQVYAEEKQKT